MQKIFRKLPSESDRINLSQLKTDVGDNSNFDYRPYLVTKPWGFEYLFFDNAVIAAWMLHLENKQATSMHCHARKKTALVVVKGRVCCTTLDGDFPLQAGQCVIIHANTFHSTRALSDDCWLMEIETPVNKCDLVRLKDSYGRVGEGYEDVGKYKDIASYPDYYQLSRQKSEFTFLGVQFRLTESLPSSLASNELLALAAFPKQEIIATQKNFLLHPVGEVFERESFTNFAQALAANKEFSFISMRW